MDAQKQLGTKINFINLDRSIHSLKTAIACLFAFAITKLIKFPVDQWIIITVLVVMCAQIYVGSVLQKAYLRFLGTLAGSVIAALTLEIFDHNPIAIAGVIACVGMLFSYLATSEKSYSDAGTLGAVTTTIILIGQNPTILTAAERFLEISIGIVIAALISQFVLPIHANTYLRRNQATTIRQLRDYYILTLMTHDTREIIIQDQELDEAIAKTLIKQRSLAKEASRELLGEKFNRNHFNHSLWCEKEILRSIAFMHHALQASPTVKKLLSKLDILQNFNKEISEVFEKIADCLEKKSSAKKIVIPDIKPIKEAVNNAMQKQNADDVFYANAFLFCTENLLHRLEKLVTLVVELAV